MKKYYENGDITTIVELVFCGYGIHAQSIFGKFVTTFSIEKGVIIDRSYISPNCFFR